MQAIATSLPPSVEQDKSVGQSEDENKTDKPVLTQLSPVQYFLEVCCKKFVKCVMVKCLFVGFARRY